MRREQHTRTFLFPHENDKVGERGKKDEKGGQKQWVGGAVLTRAPSKIKVALKTYSQKGLIFLEFLKNIP